MGVLIQETGDKFQITFPYSPYIIGLVKSIPGRQFNHDSKVWSVPVDQRDRVNIFAKRTRAVWSGATPAKLSDTSLAIPAMPELTVDIPLKGEMFPYQKQGVAYSLEKKRLIVGDSMGLGKTVQAIATISAAKAFPCLIICPASLKLNWKKEIEQWTDHTAMILEDGIKYNWHLWAGAVQFFIVNFESQKKYFVQDIEKTAKGNWTLKNVIFRKSTEEIKSVIIDESHRLKDHTTQQSKFAKGICKGKEYILALTGTPVINKPRDLMPQLSIIGRLPELLSWKDFERKFCQGPREASNLKELNHLLSSNCFYRRDKSEVLKDLPAKTRQRVICDIDTRKEYMDAERDLENYLRQYKNATEKEIAKSLRGQIMVTIGILKNISARGKIKAVQEFIQDTLENGEKLVVFAHLREVIKSLMDLFPKAVSITGEHDMHQRHTAVNSFQNDPECKLIICSTKAAGVGLTLTASSRVCFIELPWTFADCEQAEDRCHRIGQTDNVTCTYFLGDRTIDQKIYSLILEKKNIAMQVTGAEDTVEENVVSQLIDLFNQK